MVEQSQFKCFSYFKRFIRFLWEEELLELPRNFGSRQFDFDRRAKQVKVYSIEQVREMLNSLPQRFRLYSCLALNCGMLGVDMGMLRHEELHGNRIIRKRTKPRKRKDTPTVNYLLWPETIEL
jgi:hypothetical protein